MWRTAAAHERKPTEFLADAMARVVSGRDGLRRASDAIAQEAAREPLVAEALGTPQGPPHHAEGPFLEDHLRLVLQTLYAVLDGNLHLTDIEEFTRLKGYEGEVEEIEETLAENAALFETFALCHDAAKWATLYFDAPAGSRGHAEGFAEEPWAHRDDAGSAERAKGRARYRALYDAFRAARPPGESPAATQRAFHDAYRIGVHYAGHGRAVRAPAYRALLGRVAGRRSLPARDVDLLETLIAHHLDPLEDFTSANPASVLRYHALAARHGYDADDFVDLLQGCLFLDTVCGSAPHDPTTLIHFLRAEHDFAPWRRAEKERTREERRRRARNAAFRDAGLDGVALMDLLGMEPGPRFGEALRSIQEAVAGGSPLPSFGRAVDAELNRRAEAFLVATLTL